MTASRFIRVLLIGAALLSAGGNSTAEAKTVVTPKGQKTLVAFWKCVGWVYCNLKLHINIVNSDGSPGRARLISEWSPGKTYDLDVHQGVYEDSLDAYFFMAYWLYAIAETDGVRVIVGDDVAP